MDAKLGALKSARRVGYYEYGVYHCRMRGWKDIRLTRFHTAGLWDDVDDDVILSHRPRLPVAAMIESEIRPLFFDAPSLLPLFVQQQRGRTERGGGVDRASSRPLLSPPPPLKELHTTQQPISASVC